MKFRWVPWYKTTFEIDEKCIDFMERLKTAICFDDWEGKRNDFIGYVGSNRFDIFFRKFFGRAGFVQTKEHQSNLSVILLGKVKNKVEGGSEVEVYIILNWLAYLIIAPFMIIPVIGAISSSEPLFLIISLAVYSITLLFFNLRAHVLYNFFLKILHNKSNFY